MEKGQHLFPCGATNPLPRLNHAPVPRQTFHYS